MLVHLLWDSRDRLHLFLKFCLGIPTGLGLSSLGAFLWLALKLPLAAWVYLELALTVVLLVWMLKRELHLANLRFHFPKPGLVQVLFATVLLFALGMAITDFLMWAYQDPHGLDDAWAIWNVASRFVYRGGENWTQTFLRTQDMWSHPDYPLLVPISVAETWTLLQSETTRAPIALGLFWTFGCVGLVFAALWVFKGFQQAALGGVILLASSTFIILGAGQIADTPLAFYITATGVLILLYINQPHKGLARLAGFLAGLAAWTKNEGLLFVLVALAVILWVAWKYDRKVIVPFLQGLALPVLIVVFFKVTYPPPNDLFSGQDALLAKLLDPARYTQIIQATISVSQRLNGWKYSSIVILLLYGILSGLPRKIRPGVEIFALLFLLQYAGYFVIFLATPHDLAWHLDTALWRMLMQIYPLLILFVLTLCAAPKEFGMTNHAADN